MSRRRRAIWEQQAKANPPQPATHVENFFPNTYNTTGIGYYLTWLGLKRATAEKKEIKAGPSRKPSDPHYSKGDDPNNVTDEGLFR